MKISQLVLYFSFTFFISHLIPSASFSEESPQLGNASSGSLDSTDSTSITSDEQSKQETDPCENFEQRERVPSGVVASVGTFGHSVSIDVDLGEEVSGGAASVIQSSILTPRRNSCRAIIKNTSECADYKLGIKITGNDSRGGKKNVVSDTFVIRKGSQREFNFSCTLKNSYQMSIVSSSAIKK